MTMLEEPVWKDMDGNRVEFESEAYSCKLASKITQPIMVLLGDESGANLHMTGHVHIL